MCNSHWNKKAAHNAKHLRTVQEYGLVILLFKGTAFGVSKNVCPELKQSSRVKDSQNTFEGTLAVLF